MRQWIGSTLVQIMVCRLFGTKPYLNQCCVIVNWTLRNKLQWNFSQNTKIFIHGNASEHIVWEVAAILSRGDGSNVACHLHIYTLSCSSDWKADPGLIYWPLEIWENFLKFNFLMQICRHDNFNADLISNHNLTRQSAIDVHNSWTINVK